MRKVGSQAVPGVRVAGDDDRPADGARTQEAVGNLQRAEDAGGAVGDVERECAMSLAVRILGRRELERQAASA